MNQSTFSNDRALLSDSTAEPLEARRHAPLHLEAAAELRKMIAAGAIRPGEQLREVFLSNRLGVSRTPLREALRTLATEGLLEERPNRGMVVRKIGRSEAADVFAVLGALEALAAEQACKHLSPEQIDALGALQMKMSVAFERNDRDAYSAIDRDLHQLIVEASKNAPLIRAWRLIMSRADHGRRMNTLNQLTWAESFEKHQRIYDAFAARDPRLVADLMQDYFSHAAKAHVSEGMARVRSDACAGRGRGHSV